ncbi:hypothetical protein GDO78_019927 [Eleutherodactylus coqui]|uniref:Uncharacterized protein n=1 Tax=Eleutherodactylus coqui TaxID=57060 RepID=A0A8J6BIX0_ELECQ|nr:hypothetical protein GDO78_019927 [Eleutherodactylus coqui]
MTVEFGHHQIVSNWEKKQKTFDQFLGEDKTMPAKYAEKWFDKDTEKMRAEQQIKGEQSYEVQDTKEKAEGEAAELRKPLERQRLKEVSETVFEEYNVKEVGKNSKTESVEADSTQRPEEM